MKNLKKLYYDNVYVSRIDLADSAETNRIQTAFVSPFMFVFGIGNLISLIVQHKSNLKDYIISFALFGIIIFVSIFGFIYSIKIKGVSREKAYIYKSIPLYFIFSIGLFYSIHYLYFLEQFYTSILLYYINGFMVIQVFSFSPVTFIVIMTSAFFVMIPGIYSDFGLSGVNDMAMGVVFMDGLSIYKRRNEKKYIMLLKTQKNNIEARTFGNFTLLYNSKVVRFSRTKSKELLAYLIYKNGTSANTKELIAVLYGEHADSARYGSSLRNLISDIKHTFSELEIQKFFVTEYNNFRINPDVIKCDYYDLLAGDSKAIKKFNGEFMSQYSWAEEAIDFMEQMIFGKKQAL